MTPTEEALMHHIKVSARNWLDYKQWRPDTAEGGEKPMNNDEEMLASLENKSGDYLSGFRAGMAFADRKYRCVIEKVVAT